MDVKPEDLRHFRAVAEANAQLDDDRAARAARRDPGEKIVEALDLSSRLIAEAAKVGGGIRAVVDPPDEELFAQSSLHALWRNLEKKAAGQG